MEARMDSSMNSLNQMLDSIERLEARGLISHDELMEVKPMLERSIKKDTEDKDMEDNDNIIDNIDRHFEDFKTYLEQKHERDFIGNLPKGEKSKSRF